MMRQSFLFSLFLLFPFFSLQGSVDYFPQGRVFEEDLSRNDKEDVYVKVLTNHYLVLSNGSIWKRLNPQTPSPLLLDEPVILYLNNDDYVILAQKDNLQRLDECSFSSINGEPTRIHHIDRSMRQNSKVYLSDGTVWTIPSAVSSLYQWRIDDIVVAMPTVNQRTFQLINTSLPTRSPGTINYVIAS